MLETLFTHEVVAVAAQGALWDALPLPGECLEAASPSRRREFAAGRACAREALARLGFAPTAIPRGPDRAPQWPLGVVGSITHCRGFCAAAVTRCEAHRALGLDAECSGRVSEAILRRIVSDAELAALTALPADQEWRTLLWSAKESLRKCVAAAIGRLPGPREMQVRFSAADGEHGAWAAELAPGYAADLGGGAFEGRYVRGAGLVVTGIALPPAPA